MHGWIAALALLVAPGVAVAHDSFIVAPAHVAAGQPFTVQVTSSSFFPEPETAIRPNRIFRLVAVSGDRPLTPTITPDDVAMQIALSAPTDEGAVIGVSLSPWPIELPIEDLGHYMDEIGADAALRARVAEAASNGGFRETYTKHLKTIVCATICDRASAVRPIGLYMEFVTDPARPSTFRLLTNGVPTPGVTIFVTTEAQGCHPLTTDADGAITLSADLTGPVLLMAVHLQPPISPAARFTSEWAALTFDAALLSDQ